MADGGEEVNGNEVADVSCWALAYWGCGPLNRLVKHYQLRLCCDGNFPHDNNWFVSDSGESSSDDDDSPNLEIGPNGFDSDA